MASIITTRINLDKIPKDKIFVGKKGKYLDIVQVVNNELGQFGDAGNITVQQTKEEREAGVAKIYLGNSRVAWTDGQNVEKTPFVENGQPQQGPAPTQSVSPPADDLPF